MALRRPRIKPTANLSIKRPYPNQRPNILKPLVAVKEEDKDSNIPNVKIEQNAPPPKVDPPTVPSPRPPDASPQYHLPPSPRALNPFAMPRPSPSPSPVLPTRSPAHTPHYTNLDRMTAHLDDALFKSPIMSPSYPPPSRTPNIPMKVMPLDSRLDDSMKSPGSPSKAARHRFRATPVLSQRRNSVQINEDEDQQLPRAPYQRIRHISTSSTTSVQKFVPQAVGRIRTESSCSTFSDISVFKPRRAARSDEYLRLSEARRELLQKCNGAPPDKSQLRMYDMIYYNPKTNPMKQSTEAGPKERRSSVSSSISMKEENVKTEQLTLTNTPEPKEKEETAMPVPQLKLGPNGEMILDEKSLTIEATAEKEARAALAKADIVYDDLHSNSGFYKRHKRTKDWTPDETIRFYRCLQVIGTDFSLMLDLFPNRTRRDLKLKFKKEEKNNGFLINKALIDHSSFDIELLRETFKKEDETKEEERLKAEELKNKANVDRVELMKKLKQRQPSRTIRAIDDRSLDLENEHLRFRQHKPKILRQNSSQPPLDNILMSPPPSVPSARQTPNYPPPESPQPRIPSPIKSVNSDVCYYDLNLNCSTPAENTRLPDVTVDNLEVITLRPNAVEPFPEENLVETLVRPPYLPIAIKREKEDRQKVIETDDHEEEEGEDEEDDDNDDEDGLDLSNLVVLESKDPNNANVTIFKVHLVDKETEEMSEEPLDLPQEVIDYIVEAHQRNQLGEQAAA